MWVQKKRQWQVLELLLVHAPGLVLSLLVQGKVRVQVLAPGVVLPLLMQGKEEQGKLAPGVVLSLLERR